MAEASVEHPLAEVLGLALESAGDGRAAVTLEAGQRHHNPNRVVHGGVLFSMVDTAMGAATVSVLPPGSACASIEVQLRFLAPVTAGSLRAEARVLRAGSRVVQLEARLRDGDDRLVATASGSFAVVAAQL